MNYADLKIVCSFFMQAPPISVAQRRELWEILRSGDPEKLEQYCLKYKELGKELGLTGQVVLMGSHFRLFRMSTGSLRALLWLYSSF